MCGKAGKPLSGASLETLRLNGKRSPSLAEFQPEDALAFIFRGDVPALFFSGAGDVFEAGLIVHQHIQRGIGVFRHGLMEEDQRLGAGKSRVSMVRMAILLYAFLEWTKPMIRQTTKPMIVACIPYTPMPVPELAVPRLWAIAAPTNMPEGKSRRRCRLPPP